jgi:hypothetical protein
MNLKPDVEVAARASAEARQSLPDEAQDRVRLRAGGNVDALLTVEQWHVDARAEDRVDDVDGLGAVKIAAAPLEPRILGSSDDDKEIASSRLTLPVPTHSGHGESMRAPRPPQSGHVVIFCSVTPCLRWLRTSCPAPPHFGQVRGFVPCFAPEPPQAWQTAGRAT